MALLHNALLMNTLDIIVPVFNEQEVLPMFQKRITGIMDTSNVNWRVIFVDDGSSDDSLTLMQQINREDSRFGYLTLSRNFGKEYALTAGLDHATADAVVVIDVDLQDPPELIPEMIDACREGYDVVYATRKQRHGESWAKKATANWFYKTINAVSKINIPKDTGDYRLMNKKAYTAVNTLRERNRFMKGLFAWVGYKQKQILFEREPRAAGTTKWNYTKLWRFALDGITSFSYLPLRFATWIGMAVASFAFIYGAVIIGKTLIFGNDVPGYPSLMTVVLFLGGIQLTALGIIGEYLGRMFNESKQRPLYLVAEFKPPKEHQ
ncbi:glycosyltransferase family 2 protein [Marinicella rhabdoformis]|uniref:glycosyltransferase family 2 protein n=1 Tax=Marinicella rhabdoformis TaxID=2580566 RepID=UPI001FE82AD6|nr:glycosyltransferase family 2 protein [Marinicella rhabdoformis]